jgi:hypothetical protein
LAKVTERVKVMAMEMFEAVVRQFGQTKPGLATKRHKRHKKLL